jgi:hypothetical protein
MHEGFSNWIEMLQFRTPTLNSANCTKRSGAEKNERKKNENGKKSS